MYKIITYSSEKQNDVICFFRQVFRENSRVLDLETKDKDISQISTSYMETGNFWCAINDNDKIVGTIAIRPLGDFYEIRRFFVNSKDKNNGLGQKLLTGLIEYAINNKIQILKAGTMEDSHTVQYVFQKFGFKPCKRYGNSSADVFYKLVLDTSYIYNFEMRKLSYAFKNSLILNPTENIPMYYDNITSDFFEGLYVSERFKDVNDKVIFAGRNQYISFFEMIKKEWSNKLGARDVDLKTLSGLNAHLVLFLCIAKSNDTIMLLPEVCGGHFATSQILESLGVNVIHMIPDYDNRRVNVDETKALIYKEKPQYVFVDRSEGLIYEDFSWLNEFEFTYKIFDASQYFSQILVGSYTNPFDMGFDMIVSTLHKNYPGPQKGIIAVKEDDNVWKMYLQNAKTYISNTHPLAIARSLMPILDVERFNLYTKVSMECCKRLEELLINNGLPIVQRDHQSPATLHIWLLCPTKEESYAYFLKLEQLNILTNYRLLPYNLGYGLRIGVSAAVRTGLRVEHLSELAAIMTEAYNGTITSKLQKKASKFIRKVFSIGELSDKP